MRREEILLVEVEILTHGLEAHMCGSTEHVGAIFSLIIKKGCHQERTTFR